MFGRKAAIRRACRKAERERLRAIDQALIAELVERMRERQVATGVPVERPPLSRGFEFQVRTDIAPAVPVGREQGSSGGVGGAGGGVPPPRLKRPL